MKTRVLLLLGTLVLTLTGCTKQTPVTPSASEQESTEPSESSESSEEIKEEKLVGDVAMYDRERYLSTYRGMRMLGEGRANETFTKITTDKGSYFAQTNVAALAVPVDFTDYKIEDTLLGEEKYREVMQDAIFGSSDDMEWESLKSYYYKTSYGQCNITGAVTPTFHINAAATSFAKDNTAATKTWAMQIQEWVKTLDGYNLADYDKNEDGFVDCLIMLYTPPQHMRGSDDDLFWAFQWSTGSTAGTPENPKVDHFFWASYRFFFENGHYDEAGTYHDWTDDEIRNGTAKPDSHTLIHEFGHVLSLPDYYNGDYNKQGSDANCYEPIAGCDMMAHNIGDHNAFSKALYGWVAPYVAQGNAEITLRSTTDTGEFLIIPCKRTIEETGFYSLLDQYLLVEYLTPTGVAQYDTTRKYAGTYPQYYSEAGVRICLVDARPGQFTSSGFQGFTSSISAGSGYYVSFACDNNSVDGSCFPNYKLIEVIPNGNRQARTLPKNEFGSNSILYHEGDWFGSHGNFNNFPFHSTDGTWNSKKGLGEAFGFELNIKRIDENGARIVINELK